MRRNIDADGEVGVVPFLQVRAIAPPNVCACLCVTVMVKVSCNNVLWEVNIGV